MPRMIDLIRASAVPASLMQSAAKGALSVPADEMIEILVYLATKNPVFRERARMTLAGWDEVSSRAVAADPRTTRDVLDYLISADNLRPALLPGLLENFSVSDASLATLAASCSRDLADMMLKSDRVAHAPEILTALASNANLSGIQARIVKEKLSEVKATPSPATTDSKITASREAVANFDGAAPAQQDSVEAAPDQAQSDEPVIDEAVPDEAIAAYLSEHAAEIKAETGKPFKPIGGVHEEFATHSEEVAAEPAAASTVETVAKESAESAAAAAHRAPAKKSFLGPGHEKGSALKKISQLDIKGRIQLAMKGTKEERSILIRDGTKIVALAVLESPKVTDGEVEKFAGQRNVLEHVLRAIPMKRRFVKQYAIVRSLVFNPRCPIDVSLGLIKNLLTADLRHLSGNKEVSDTVRKMATRMFRQKLEVHK